MQYYLKDIDCGFAMSAVTVSIYFWPPRQK